jgi:CheY-like chemotaxis protein
MRPTGWPSRPATPVVLIVDPDPATQLLLEWAAELEGLTALAVPSSADAYGILAEDTNQIILVVLDLACGGDDAVAARRLQLDAPRVASIPAVVLTDRSLTDTDRTVLRPAITVMKPLQVEEAREIMRGGRSATWREGAFIRGLATGNPGIVLH